MGFFSNLKPDISSVLPKPLPVPGKSPRNVNGVELVGLSAQLKKGKENIIYCRLADISRPIVISGAKGSGKTLLAKAIMQDSGIRYTVLDLRNVRHVSEIYTQFESLGSVNDGIIIEGVEDIADWDYINAVNTLLTKEELERSMMRTVHMSEIAVIFTQRKENVFLNYKNVCLIKTKYKRDDYVSFFLNTCRKEGVELSGNRVHIDNKAIAFIGGLLGNNIELFENWTRHVVKLGSGKERLVINMDNIVDMLPKLLAFDRT